MIRLAIVLIVASLALVACDEKKIETAALEEAPTAVEPPAQDEAEPEEAPAEAEPADGQWVSSESYGVKFRVAEDWKVQHEEDNISATSADGTITVLLVGTESEGLLQAALESVKKKVAFKDLNLTKDSQTVVNGMPGYTAQGSAVLVKDGGDQEIEFIMNSVRVGDKGVAMMIFAEAEMYEAKKEEVDGIARTLQKL